MNSSRQVICSPKAQSLLKSRHRNMHTCWTWIQMGNSLNRFQTHHTYPKNSKSIPQEMNWFMPWTKPSMLMITRGSKTFYFKEKGGFYNIHCSNWKLIHPLVSRTTYTIRKVISTMGLLLIHVQSSTIINTDIKR